MNLEEYNGWPNYETWKVHLEFFDDQTLEDIVDIKLIDEADYIDDPEGYKEALDERQQEMDALDGAYLKLQIESYLDELALGHFKCGLPENSFTRSLAAVTLAEVDFDCIMRSLKDLSGISVPWEPTRQDRLKVEYHQHRRKLEHVTAQLKELGVTEYVPIIDGDIGVDANNFLKPRR